MTPLLGTKNPSAPVGDKSGGGRRAARAVAFQVFTKHETRNTAFFRITAFLPSRQARRLQGEMYEAVRKRVERGLSESREKNNDFFRISIRFKIRNSSQFVTIRREDSDKPLPPIKRPRALRQSGHRLPGCIASPPDLPWPAGLAKWRSEGRTDHESRLFSPSVRKGRTTGNPRPDCRPRRPAAAFLRVVARHGAAMARHGRPSSPAPATRPVEFSPATNHATWFFPCPPAAPRRATPSPANRFSRITRHGFYAFLPTISHDFPVFPGPPHPPGQGSARRSHRQHGRSGFLRDTNHESRPFFACFDLRMVRHAG